MPMVRSLLIAATLLFAASSLAIAGQPTYWIVQAPALRVGKHHTEAIHPGYGIGLPDQPYAYGWFGHGSPPHWTKSYGHNRQYRQWEKR